MFIGIAMFLILMLMGGIIAFLGDKIGTKVGKRRMTLFGLRPRYTSVIVTVIAGILISFMTVAALAVVNENVRVALFGLNRLRSEMQELNQEISIKNAELEKGRTLLASRNEELKQVEEQQMRMKEQLSVVEQAYGEARRGVEQSAEEIKALETVRDNLNGNIATLNEEKEFLAENVYALREGKVIFRAGQVLTSVVVDKGMTKEEASNVLTSILNDINGLIKERMSDPDKDAYYVRVLREDFDRASDKLAGAEHRQLIRIVAAQNLIIGDRLAIDFDIHDSLLIFRKGQSIMKTDMENYKNIKNYDLQVITFLKDLNEYASQQGVLPDPITGDIGVLDGQELKEVIRQVKEAGGRCVLEATAKRDIYTNGPLLIEVKVWK